MTDYHCLRARPALLAALTGSSFIAFMGCTYGVVTDNATGAGIQGATITYQQLSLNTPVVLAGAPAIFTAEPVALPVQSWTAAELAATNPAGDSSFAGFYWLNPYAPRRGGDTTGTLVLPGWKRVVLSAPGYTTMFAYRNHQYIQSEVEMAGPYSGPGPNGQSPYPAPASALVALPGAMVAQESFGMWKQPSRFLPFATSVHSELPDLIVDVRSLLPTAAGAATPSPQEVGVQNGPIGGEGFCCSTVVPGTNITANTQECLAFPLNVANVGRGRFELLSTSTPLSPVTQVIYDSAGNHTMSATTGSIIAAEPGGFHVANLVQMRLRGPLVTGCNLSPPTAGCCDTEATALACPVVSLGNKPICLEHDSDGIYDSQLFQQFTPNGSVTALNGGALGCAASATGDIDTGLAPGASEMYMIGNAYNFLDITNVQPGTYWLEAEINPANASGVRTYLESDTTNNIARAAITIATPPPGGGGRPGGCAGSN